jgi:hypothetical protein
MKFLKLWVACFVGGWLALYSLSLLADPMSAEDACRRLLTVTADSHEAIDKQLGSLMMSYAIAVAQRLANNQSTDPQGDRRFMT